MKAGEKANDDMSVVGGYQEFGWEFFTAASEKAKRQYMGQQVKAAFVEVHRLCPEVAAIIASKWAGVKIEADGYVDHQSGIGLPCSSGWQGPQVRKDFFDDFLGFILQPDIVIAGGSDNQDGAHPIIESERGTNILKDRWNDKDTGSLGLRLLFDHGSSALRARYDKQGKFWVVFDSSSGTKIRLSFVPDSDAEKSEVPELVDVKLTNCCTKGCSYCYQGSLPDGKHAEKQTVREVAQALGSLGTFEVALGGGEPTSHPDFLEILREFQVNDVKPSFSTRNEDWVVRNWDKLSKIIGGVGLSIDNSYELVDKLSKLRELKNLNLTVHVVVGCCSDYELEHIMEICKIFNTTLLLLGWKNCHRGRDIQPKEIDLKKILDSFKGEPIKWENGHVNIPWNGPRIAFDTVLAQEMKGWLEENANTWSFTTKEGAHSMYIDCVDGKMARSSYEVDESAMEDLAPKEKGQRSKYVPDRLEKHIKKYFRSL